MKWSFRTIKILKTTRKKVQIAYKESSVRLTADFSTAKMKTRNTILNEKGKGAGGLSILGLYIKWNFFLRIRAQ